VQGVDYQSSMDVTNLSIGLGRVADPANGGPSGSGVTVAVLDSGVSTNTDLPGSRVVGWKDFVNGRSTPYDDAGHGTFVAGLIAGDGTASLPVKNGGYATTQFRGVAPGASLVGVKVLDQTGQGRASGLIAGIAWTIAHRAQYGIRVMNLSVGGDPVASVVMDPIARAVEAAWRAGIVVVCSAGNEGDFGPGSVLSPGNDPFALTVGATDTKQTADTSDDSVAYYSSYGPTLYDGIIKPDLVAPGNRLISLRTSGSYIDTNFPENTIPVADFAPGAPDGTQSNYLMLSGTSTSTPVVAGAAALLIGKDPSLTPGDVKLRLMETADPIAAGADGQEGAGALDVAGALADRHHARGWALSSSVDGHYDPGDYLKWDGRAWMKYGWTKFKWTDVNWDKFKWTDYNWDKFKWTKFKWTDVSWNKFKWTKFKWTDVAWTKFKWTKFKWTEYDWTKFKWTILLNGQ
jgi:serine protease AprX